MLLLLLDENFIRGFFTEVGGQFGYLAPFTILVLAGAGLPIPEEISLIGSGFLLFQGQVELIPIVLVCCLGVWVGDQIPYWLGRWFGLSAIEMPLVRRIVHPERFAVLEERFRRHGNWAVFTCRFLPGVRLPGFFIAGTMGMSYGRFMAIDVTSGSIMVPAYVLLGRAFGARIDELETTVENLHLVLGFGVLLLASLIVVRLLVARRERQAARIEATRAEVEGQGEAAWTLTAAAPPRAAGEAAPPAAGPQIADTGTGADDASSDPAAPSAEPGSSPATSPPPASIGSPRIPS